MRLLIVLAAVVGCVLSAPQHTLHPFLHPQPHLSHHWVVPGARHNTEGPQLFDHHGRPVMLPDLPHPPLPSYTPQHLDSPQASSLNRPPLTVQHNPEQVRSSLSPLMRLAVDTGVVQAAGSSYTGSPQYVVSPHLAEEVGGVSSLAYRLGAVPVAAVHDVQMRPNFEVSESAFAPVLIHQEKPEVTLYTLEVPIQ